MYDVSSCVNSTFVNNSDYFVNLIKIRTRIRRNENRGADGSSKVN